MEAKLFCAVECRECNECLTPGQNWYHRQGSADDDLCYEHWQHLPREQKALFKAIDTYACLQDDCSEYTCEDYVVTYFEEGDLLKDYVHIDQVRVVEGACHLT